MLRLDPTPHPTVFEREAPPRADVEAALADSRQRVLWREQAGPRRRRPELVGRHAGDLVIVGGGYTGLWTALRAVERDPQCRVVLLEAASTGWAASGRNGGFCEASLTHGEENGRSRWPQEYGELARLGRENLDAIESTVQRYGMDVEWERTGTLSVANEPYQAKELSSTPSTPEATVLDRAGVRAQLDSPTYLGGVWHRRDTAMVQPARLASELARVAQERGVEVFEGTRATAISAEGQRVRVRTERGEVVANSIALASGPFPSLLRRYRLHTVPVYDYVLATEPLTDAQLARLGWSNRQGVADQGNLFHYYRLTADNRIVWGGYDAVYHLGGRIAPRLEHRPATFEALASHFLTTFPQLSGVRFTHRWAGVIDTSTRFTAFFGQGLRGRVVSAAGFTGLGVGASRFAADVLLDRLDGADTDRTRLEMVRGKPLLFPPEPFAALGVNATRWSLARADANEGKRNVLLRALDAVGLGFDS